MGTARKRREMRIISSRPGDTLDGLVASFRPEVQPIARAMYTAFQEFTCTRAFRFRKSDDIAQTTNFDPIDIVEAVTKIGYQFGCPRPSREDLRGRKTFEDYVELVNQLRPGRQSQG
jgi:hypothetical protein